MSREETLKPYTVSAVYDDGLEAVIRHVPDDGLKAVVVNGADRVRLQCLFSAHCFSPTFDLSKNRLPPVSRLTGGGFVVWTKPTAGYAACATGASVSCV